MRRSIISIALCSLVFITACGNTAATNSTGNAEKENVAKESNVTTGNALSAAEAEGKSNDAATDSHSSIEVDEGLLTVEISIPATFVGEDTTQEDIDKSVKENGYISGKLNSDGSATYKMTKSKHEELMARIKDSIDTQLKDMVGSEDYPNFVDVKANDDYTWFTITTKSSELGLMESMSTLMFYMYGGMYAAFSGNPVDNIHVDYVNEATGVVIQSADSENMGSGSSENAGSIDNN